jgi:chemotaxis protein CheZ
MNNVMNAAEDMKKKYGSRMLSLSAALDAGNETAFTTELNALMREHDDGLWTQLRKLTADLSGALERFQLDSRLLDLAEKEVPDAKHRLDYVLQMTDKAAHQTMDLVDQSGPLAERIAKDAEALTLLWQQFRSRQITPADFHVMLKNMDSFLVSAQRNSEDVRKNLAEVLMTQGYQDLSGQIIRGVIKLVGEVEVALNALVSLATNEPGRATNTDERREARGYGPVIPGMDNGVVVGGQQDIDALLSGLGI